MGNQQSSARGDTILDVHDLKTYFYTEDGVVKAVDGVDFSVKAGQVLGLVEVNNFNLIYMNKSGQAASLP